MAPRSAAVCRFVPSLNEPACGARGRGDSPHPPSGGRVIHTFGADSMGGPIWASCVEKQNGRFEESRRGASIPVPGVQAFSRYPVCFPLGVLLMVKRICAPLLLAFAFLALATSGAEAGLFGRGCKSKCCEPVCCEPVCEPSCCAAPSCEPSCCVAEPSCCAEPCCCEPAPCCKKPGLFERLRACFKRNRCKSDCCAPACEPSCCAPSCEPSCGCN